MKEYLFKNSFGEYKQVDPELVVRVLPLKHWVEIPDDAEVVVHLNCWKSSAVFFWKDGGDTIWNDQQGKPYWVDCDCSDSMSLCEFLECWQGGCTIVWEREKQQEMLASETLTKTPFTYDNLLGCYVSHKVDSEVDGHIIETADIGRVMVVVDGQFAPFGIFPEGLTFYTEDNQPISFEQYKEMYYGATYSEETSQ